MGNLVYFLGFQFTVEPICKVVILSFTVIFTIISIWAICLTSPSFDPLSPLLLELTDLMFSKLCIGGCWQKT